MDTNPIHSKARSISFQWNPYHTIEMGTNRFIAGSAAGPRSAVMERPARLIEACVRTIGACDGFGPPGAGKRRRGGHFARLFAAR